MDTPFKLTDLIGAKIISIDADDNKNDIYAEHLDNRAEEDDCHECWSIVVEKDGIKYWISAETEGPEVPRLGICIDTEE